MKLWTDIWKKVELQDGGCLALASNNSDGTPLSVHDINHNIFRLDKDDNVIWQIQRDENGILNWESLHRHAREQGQDGARWPFEMLSIVYADGTHNHSPQTGNPPPVDTWVPNCRILSTSAQGYGYEIDIERGVARNTADRPQRPW